MDEIVFDEFSVACDKLQLKLSTYESCLHLQRTKRSAPKAVPPSIPDGVLEPKELTHMRSPFASIKDIPKGFFANREASIHASNMYRGPFRRALFLLNHMFLDTLRDSITRGLENVFNLFAQYDVVPVDPTVELFARSLARQRRKKRSEKRSIIRIDIRRRLHPRQVIL